MLTKLGLDKSITKISGGERQLAFICRALVQESNIFIFDDQLLEKIYKGKVSKTSSHYTFGE